MCDMWVERTKNKLTVKQTIQQILQFNVMSNYHFDDSCKVLKKIIVGSIPTQIFQIKT